jgi:hypothetical protein
MGMSNLGEDVLRNPTREQFVESDPLMEFSFYLSGRRNVLLATGREIVDNLDQGFSGNRIDGARVEHAESLMWLWTFGAYEVVRTMCQAKVCFSKRLVDNLMALKKTLSAARMPAAKMEKVGRKVPVDSNRSPAAWDMASRDLFVNDPT